MAADMHIHVLEGVTEADLADFFSGTMGSKHFDWGRRRDARERRERDLPFAQQLVGRIAHTPQVDVGEVSWLKAAVFAGGAEEFVPQPVALVSEIIGEDLPVIDEELISRVAGAFEAPNQTGYDVDDGRKVVAFLREHQGKRCFTVSW